MKKKRIECLLGQWLVCVLLALLSASVIAQDPADRCGLPNIKKAFGPYEQQPARKAQVFQIQEGLKTIFDKTTRRLSDGIIGPVTRESLETFCREYPVFGTFEEVPDAVRRSLLHYQEIAAEYPDWKKIIASSAFDAWVREPRDDDQIDTRQIRRSGAAPVVIKLLEEFASRSAEGGSPAHGADDESCSPLLKKTVVDHELEEFQGLDRFKQKKSTRIELQRGLEAVFEGNPEYDDSDGKVEQVMLKWLERFCREYPVFSQSPDNVPRRVVESVLHYAEIAAARPNWRDLVTDPGFNQWVVSKGAPENRPLRLSGSAPIVIKLIDEYPIPPPPPTPPPRAGAATYYQLSALDLQRLNDRAGFLIQVDELVGKQFDTEAELDEAIGPIADLLMVDSEREKFLKTIRDNKRTLTIGWRLTRKSLNRVRDQLTSPTVTQGAANILQALGELENEDFESKQKLAQDVKARLLLDGGDAGASDVQSGPRPEPARHTTEARIKAVVKKVVAAAEEVTAYGITAKAVAKLKRDPPLFVALPDDVRGMLTPLRDVAYADQRLYASAVRNALTTKDAPEVVQAVVAWARKKGEAKAPLEIHATDCGCAREWDSVGKNRFTVYGFYPFWMSARDAEKVDPGGGDDASAQTDDESEKMDGGAAVDFSVLSRIGYFAVELDEEGNIPDRRLWTAEDGAERFIKTAHRYRSKVDLVIEARHWHTWELPSEQDWDNSNLKQAVDSIWSLLDPQSKSTSSSMLPDGVVLYFPDFPSHSDKTEMIVNLVKKLRKKLDAGGQETTPSLNILLDVGDLEGSQRIHDAGDLEGSQRIHPSPEQELFAGLKDILVKDPAMVELMLVFLGQPVTEMKKRLRLAVENQFDGEERVSVLRKILPVIPPNGHRVETSEQGPYRQLQDDLVYFRDNFRGVAFWPVPTARDKDPEELRNRLVSTFAQSQAPGDGAQVLKTLVPDFCVYVCPNRLAYQIAFFVLLGLLILLALLASWSCRVRNALKKRFWHVLAGVAMLIAISVALITCDPVWNDQQLNILGGLVVFLIGSWLFHYIRKVKQGPLP